MRRLRHIPPGGALIEVTTRTLEGRFLLKPSKKFNQIALGVLALAQKKSQITLHAFVFMSGHYHLLLTAGDALQLSSFMCFLNSNLAREAGLYHDWKTIIWARRFQGIPVSEEPGAQEKRLRYFLAHGVKEDLVDSPRRWPGLHFVKNILDGESLKGIWIDRKRMNEAKQRQRKRQTPKDFISEHEIHLTPLPYLSHLTPEQYRTHIAELVREIEETHRQRRIRDSIPLPGAQQILQMHPHTRPQRLKWSPAPPFHTYTPTMLKALREAYSWFLEAYRDAATRLRAGDLNVTFPRGCFPPALPFVPP